MRRKRMLMTSVHFALAVLALLVAADGLMKAAGFEVPIKFPQYVAMLPISISMLLRSISEFAEAEKEYVELRNS